MFGSLASDCPAIVPIGRSRRKPAPGHGRSPSFGREHLHSRVRNVDRKSGRGIGAPKSEAIDIPRAIALQRLNKAMPGSSAGSGKSSPSTTRALNIQPLVESYSPFSPERFQQIIAPLPQASFSSSTREYQSARTLVSVWRQGILGAHPSNLRAREASPTESGISDGRIRIGD